MTTRELKSELAPTTESLAPASRTATVNGASADLRGYDSALVVINRGAAGGTTPSFTFEVQESDDDSTFTAVADGDLDGTEPVVTAAGVPVEIGYKGVKRYLRVAITAVSGTAPTLLCSANIHRGHAHVSPAN